ncbi:MarR family winged helix-turn-helix transcriptional regulator [Eubacterium ventriosum]|uniref:MarR family winged helix-turn-helix transcriptional regulator n=1 Tax=Eubacterium ventriosum TaxID=39496 RepID=UPI00399194FC
MKDKKWKDMIGKHGELRFFSSMAIKKSHKGHGTSAQELDMLFRVALSKEKVTPGYLKDAMGISKTIISRLIEQLENKQLIEKIRTNEDKRSYTFIITEKGKKEIDDMYYYYLNPLYTLKENMTEEDFEQLFKLIRQANKILAK